MLLQTVTPSAPVGTVTSGHCIVNLLPWAI